VFGNLMPYLDPSQRRSAESAEGFKTQQIGLSQRFAPGHSPKSPNPSFTEMNCRGNSFSRWESRKMP